MRIIVLTVLMIFLAHLIFAVHTTAATGSDIPALADVHTRLDANRATPGEHYLDEGYVIAEAIATGAADGIEIVGPLTRNSSWQAKQNSGYDKSAFTLDWDARVPPPPRDVPAAHGPAGPTWPATGPPSGSDTRTA